MKFYSFPEKYEQKSKDFVVTAKGEHNIDVYCCDVSAYPSACRATPD